MNRKVLFIISNMETGGVSKSMTSLMNVIDRDRYDVALMIVDPSGALMELLPPDLRLITNPVWSALTSKLAGFFKLIKMGKIGLAVGHLVRLGISLFSKAKAGQMIAHLMPGIDEEFDTIVDFNGQQQLYYMIDKLHARKKITFFHNDYKKWPYYYKADKKYFSKVDSVWTISEVCADSLRDVFPEYAQKVRVMGNISSPVLINQLASQNQPSEMNMNIPSIISLGHACERKGTHWAIEAASILKKEGLVFNWYFIGANPGKERFDAMRQHLDVDDRVHFLCIKTNPYPYLKAATMVAHPAQYEGKSIALDEAKLLCKPIVATNFSTVKDQFVDRHNATICEMNPQSLANAIKEMLVNEPLRKQYSSILQKERKDNTDEIKKLYCVLDK